MEHYPQAEPMKRRARFSFEAFDTLCAEALSDLPEPAQPDDNVIDLNANVVELRPPDDAA